MNPESPEKIRQLTFTREDLEAVFKNPDHAPEEIMALLDKDFKDYFDADAGVKEGYSLRRHTLMVMHQFKKYFKNTEIDGKDFFEFILALHDIGKPNAIRAEGKQEQHKYTKQELTSILPQLGYEKKDIDFAEALIDGDAIGHYLRGGSVSETAREIVDSAFKSGLPLMEFWKILLIFFQVDAGAYTEDAGGTHSLDELFSFEPEFHTMSFSKPTMRKIELLEQEIKRSVLKNI